MSKRSGPSRRKAIRSIAAGLFASSPTIQHSARVLAQAAQDAAEGIPDDERTPFTFTPFTVPLPLPRTKTPLAIGNAPFTPGDVFHGIAPEFFDRRVAERPDLQWYEAHPTKWYQMRMQLAVQQIIPRVRTPLFGYDGIYPGPTIRARVGQPVVVRAFNDLNIETSIHLHGGHNPAHSDGYPNFYVLPGRARDYLYTNTVPMLNGQPDFSESPSTMWYHDHALDITAANVWYGLSGFFITTDDLEQDLIDRNVLPAEAYDIPLSLQDRRFRPNGTLFFDPLDHDGTLGDIWVVNGKAQPFMRVQRRKYRFRILNGCNARVLEMRLSNDQPFIRLGKDTWLYPNAIEENRLLLSMAQRADVVIDFTNAPNELFLENILVQKDGRGPEGQLDDPELQIPGTRFMKFIVEGEPQANSATVDVGTPLRPHVPINSREIVRTRVFEFTRRNGAWQINRQFFDPDTAQATPTLGTAERWILRNNGGGWWHPIHIHLESHQIRRLNGRVPGPADRFKNDTVILDGNGEAEIFMKFRTFKGPFVFHCHNVEHEDMRMMFAFDPRVTPTNSPQPIQASFP
jgi:FtsP/CotA-like multicopper oxidase with cupredoxin domain